MVFWVLGLMLVSFTPFLPLAIVLLGVLVILAGFWTTAVNIFEKQRNLLWANDLKQLITCYNYNYILIHILFYIVNANLIVKMGGMGKDQVAPDHPDNPSSRC